MAKRRNFTANFKSKVAIEALQERLTLAELAQKHKIHANQISTWKKELLEGSKDVFSKKRGPSSSAQEEKEAKLYQQIGQLQFELDWLKKKHSNL